jgi:hypothetical protein
VDRHGKGKYIHVMEELMTTVKSGYLTLTDSKEQMASEASRPKNIKTLYNTVSICVLKNKPRARSMAAGNKENLLKCRLNTLDAN